MAKIRIRLAKRLPWIVGALAVLMGVPLVYATVDAPTGFDNLTNGFETQTQFDTDRAQFETLEQIADGLGPTYNAQACAECHQNPVSGSASQITEVRAGQTVSGVFTDHPGGSLVQDRAIDRSIQEHVFHEENTHTFRISLNTLGDGFVEALPDSEFFRVQNAQPTSVRGTIIYVPVLEATPVNGVQPTRIGRFGWKNQHSSLLSFAADAYLNEIGITSPLFPTENTADGNSVAAFDTVSDPEDPATMSHPFGPDVEAFTSFMRSTKAPPRGPIDSNVTAGEQIFHDIGCADCHTDSLVTAPASTSFNGGTFVVDSSLGSKTIHPYSDFMLHDIGTQDGIVQNGGAATRTMVRTAPLWGLATRSRLMHDGESATIRDAILRHAGQALPAAQAFSGLNGTQKGQLVDFLNSL